MQVVAIKILLTLALAIFSFGIATMVLRKHPIWMVIGQIMALKGVTFGIFILVSVYHGKMELLSVLLFSGVFFMVLFSLVGFGLMIRSKRFETEA